MRRTRRRVYLRSNHGRLALGPITPISVLLVDDHPSFLHLVTDYLAGSVWIKVIGTAASGDEAVAMVRDLQPDLVLMDLAMSGMNGLEATYRIKRLEHPPRVVVMTLHGDQEYRTQAAAVGADGFLSKADTVMGLLPLIRLLFAHRELA